MIACVLNQLGGHWFLFHALNYFITLNLRTLREKTKIQPTFNPFMDDDGRGSFELFVLVFNIRKDIARNFDSCLTFLRSYEKNKAHNMLSLMLNPRFKGLCLVLSYVGRE
jgi:hypothetical protein